MTVEVYQSPNESSGNTTQNPDHDYPQEGFELATFFSGSVNFNIIDSYSSASTPTRYNGDPIDNGSWAAKTDVASANSWFVIESIDSPTTPQWQAKIQWTDEYTNFDDPSGLDYQFETSKSKVLIRFAPHGGWDLDPTTPDFNPTGYPTNPSYRSTDNCYFHAGYAGLITRWYLVTDVGQLCRFGDRREDPPYRMLNFAGFYGDITPIDGVEQTMPRVAIPAKFNGNGSLDVVEVTNSLLTGDSNTCAWGGATGGVAVEDSAGALVQGAYMQPSAMYILNASSQYNQHGATPKIDTLPYYVISTTHGVLGTVSMFERGYGPGITLVGAKEWLSTRNGYCLMIKWDGSTNLTI